MFNKAFNTCEACTWIERKQILQTLVPPQPARLLYVSHIEGRGVDLFRAVSALVPDVLGYFDLLDCYRALNSKRIRLIDSWGPNASVNA